MIPDLFWIPGPWRGRLAISTRPRGGDWLEDEIRSLHAADVDVLVSLLEKAEESQLELGEEGRLAVAHGLRFVQFPIADRGVPASLEAAVGLIREISYTLGEGDNVAIHCRQGIGRSGLIAAGTLIAAGIDPDSALKSVGAARGLVIPETPQQRLWVERLLADHLVTK